MPLDHPSQTDSDAIRKLRSWVTAQRGLSHHKRDPSILIANHIDNVPLLPDEASAIIFPFSAPKTSSLFEGVEDRLKNDGMRIEFSKGDGDDRFRALWKFALPGKQALCDNDKDNSQIRADIKALASCFHRASGQNTFDGRVETTQPVEYAFHYDSESYSTSSDIRMIFNFKSGGPGMSFIPNCNRYPPRFGSYNPDAETLQRFDIEQTGDTHAIIFRGASSFIPYERALAHSPTPGTRTQLTVFADQHEARPL